VRWFDDKKKENSKAVEDEEQSGRGGMATLESIERKLLAARTEVGLP
jgi:hypothetical protein